MSVDRPGLVVVEVSAEVPGEQAAWMRAAGAAGRRGRGAAWGQAVRRLRCQALSTARRPSSVSRYAPTG